MQIGGGPCTKDNRCKYMTCVRSADGGFDLELDEWMIFSAPPFFKPLQFEMAFYN